MADPRFFSLAGPFTLRELAAIAKAELGPGTDPQRLIIDVAPLETAGPQDISFIDNRRYVDTFRKSRAGACVVAPDLADKAPEGMALVITPQPYRGYALIAQAFHPEPAVIPGCHESAVIDPSARIGAGSRIGPGVVIGARVEIGRDCDIGPHTVIDDGVVIGDETKIGANAYLGYCLIGRRCRFHAGVRIGNRGFGFAMDPDGYVDVPQLGRVIVEDDVEIGANSTIDRGAGPDTVIGAGCKIDNLVQIGHNVRLGRGCVLVAQSGIAGSTKLDDFVVLAAQAGVAGHLTIGKGAQLAAKTGVMRDVPAGQAVAGAPAMPVRDFFRLVAIWQRQLKAKGKRDE
ncbi:MAG: UDP-3-O-(3-hydroxymyristoyl)glucosamine N-acyltransferase [Alphaproteobacteria bacterium]|nr:MAG: UDP-3-O-(3-hydroxymyristoyl)glucosamine N-acyltransferase [Alphaproteobacteria bacterium]